ncbi:MAG: apolipoprotein N-acyltransferase [Opitutales bacterium]
MSTLPSAPDPYEPRSTLWQRRPHLGWALGVFACTVVLTYVAFPPSNQGEAAYAFAIPAVLWAYRRPPFRIYAWSVLGAQVVAWTSLLGWLHHVTWAGLLLLGPFIGLLIGLWHVGVWWTMPRLRGHPAMVRILGMLGLASLWVLLEWVRSRLFTGFPWLPLAASQWQKPALLQVAAYTGAWGISFALITFNLGAAAYAHRIFFEGATGLRKRSPEFTIALVVLMSATFPFIGDFFNQKREKLLRAALVQPAIPQAEKWDPSSSPEVLRLIEQTTFEANASGAPEVIVWPEASVPWVLQRDPNMALWLESVSHRTGKPLLLGSVSLDRPGTPGEQWRNGAFTVDPIAGVQYPGYAKRHLVPFGEYIPLRSVFGWLEKFVPIGGDDVPGDNSRPLQLNFGVQRLPVGVLICYEDLFPELARASARNGAELLAVLTNDAWYGEGGETYQHAAHSVLRAVETRRPLLRCGNNGWSGWIDEFGNIRAVVTNEDGRVHFRGSRTVTITRDARWRGRQSFYTEHGDWLILLCAVLATVGYYTVLMLRPPRPTEDGEPVY